MTARRKPVRPRRATRRRRAAPQEDAAWWEAANVALWTRSGGSCDHCGRPLNGRAERHHRMRRRDGGDRLSQIALLCPPCHHWITEHPKEARRTGHIVATWADPETVPMLSRGQWLLLDDQGTTRVLALPLDADAHDVAPPSTTAELTTPASDGTAP